jgi:hypothetical protein
MDTRIACGLVWKLRDSDQLTSIRAKLMSIPRPRCVLRDEKQEVWCVSTSVYELTVRTEPSAFYEFARVHCFVKKPLAPQEIWANRTWEPSGYFPITLLPVLQ